METSMNTTENELNTLQQLEDFSKIEVFEKYLVVKQERDKNAIRIEELEATVERLRELLRLGQSRTYGTSSEKSIDPEYEQMSMLEEGNQGVFNEAECYVETEVKAHVRRKKGQVGPTKPCFDHLPVVEVIEEPTPEDMICDQCGNEKRVVRTNIRYEVGIKPVELYLIKHISKVLVCDKCNEQGNAPITDSAKQLPVFPGSYASSSMLAYIMAKKYWEKVPIHRLEKMFWYSGIKLSRSLMSKWIIDGAEMYLRGLYDRLHEELLKSPIIGADETKLQVLRELGRTAKQESFMWIYVSGHLDPHQIALYQYRPGRAGNYAKEFLEGFSGVLLTDAFPGYGKVPGVEWASCHAHARRKFVDALKAMGEKTNSNRGTMAQKGLAYFDELFRLERSFSQMSPEERYKARLEQSKPLLEAFKAWLHESKKTALMKSKLGEAILYCLNQWPRLTVFLEHPNLELSNNRAERGMKEFVIGRKNFLFSTSVAGAQASEVIFSIVETAKLNKLHPYEYLKYIIDELSQNRQTEEKLNDLLPWSDKLPERLKIKYDPT